MVVLDEIVIPRFLAWATNGMSEVPTKTGVGAESGSITILSDLIRIVSYRTMTLGMTRRGNHGRLV